jgi:hypothetical protein
MRTSAFKTLAAIGLATASCAIFAQQATDADPAGTTTMPPAADSVYGAPGYTYGYPSYNRDRAGRYGRCAGMSDRQTERACRVGFPTEHIGIQAPPASDHGGFTDDQAG